MVFVNEEIIIIICLCAIRVTGVWQWSRIQLQKVFPAFLWEIE